MAIAKIVVNLSVFLLLGLSLESRNPQNIVGTDIYPDQIFGTFRRNTSKETFDLLPFSLPTKALNLAYGAECFTVCLKPLYHVGELVVTERVEVVRPEPLAGAGAGAGGVELFHAGVGGLIGSVRNNFYKEIVNKEPLPYEACNPLAILVRCMFNQVPGTFGLDNFRVSKNCILFREDGLLDYAQTIIAWAQFVTTMLKLYEQHDVFQADQKKLAKAVDATARFSLKHNFFLFKRPLEAFQTNLEKKPKMAHLLSDCVSYANKNGLGIDFPLRILMAGVYALFGHEKSLIMAFYKELQKNMAVTFSPEGFSTLDISTELSTAINQKIDALSGLAVEDDSPSQQAYGLLKQYLGSFNPIAYEKISIGGNSFYDCFETLLRNIVITLLQVGGSQSLKKGIVRPDFDAFFDKHGEAEQYTQLSHDEWGVLVSNISGALYGTVGYELVPTMPNLLFMLNYIFDLKIMDFTEDFAIDSEKKNNSDFITSMLREVNQALAEKLSLDPTQEIIVLDESSDFGTDVGATASCTLYGELITLNISIDYYQHGEASVVKEGHKAELYRGAEQFPFLVQAIKGVVVKADSAGGADSSPHTVNIVSNLALLSDITREKFYLLLQECRSNALLVRMLYNIAAQYYDHKNPSEFFSLLNDIRVVVALPDQVYALVKNVFDLKYSRFILNNAAILFSLLIEQGLFYKEALEYIDKEFNDKTVGLLMNIIKKDDAPPIAIEKAKSLALEKVHIDYMNSYYLADALVSKGVCLDEVSLVVDGLFIEKPNLAILLLQKLVEAGHSIDKAIAAVKKYITDSDYQRRSYVDSLIAMLLDKGYSRALEDVPSYLYQHLILEDFVDGTAMP